MSFNHSDISALDLAQLFTAERVPQSRWLLWHRKLLLSRVSAAVAIITLRATRRFSSATYSAFFVFIFSVLTNSSVRPSLHDLYIYLVDEGTVYAESHRCMYAHSRARGKTPEECLLQFRNWFALYVGIIHEDKSTSSWVIIRAGKRV